MSDSISVFAEHSGDYHAERRRLVPCIDALYGTAVELLGRRGGEIRRVLDLGAGTGLMSEWVLARYPDAEIVLLDGAAEMLAEARARLPEDSIVTLVGDLRDELPEGPFDAVVSALAIHHIDDPAKRELFARIREVLRPSGVFANAEQVAAPSAWLEGIYRESWSEQCRAAGATEQELSAAEGRMETDRCSDVGRLLEWMSAAGLSDCDCFFKQAHFAVLGGWRT